MGALRLSLLLAVLTTAACQPGPDADVVRSGEPEGSVGTGGPARVPASTTAGGRVVILGTSLTAGMGLDSPREAYPALVDDKIDSAGLPFRVVNAGVSGETSAGGLRRIGWLLREPVDVLVVELGANDALRGQDTEALERNLLAIIDSTLNRYPAAGIVVAGMEAPPNLGPTYVDEVRSVFPRVAEARDAALIPFLLEGVAGHPELNQADGIHPTAEGHRVMAELVWQVLAPVLRERLSAEPEAPR